jgi:TetR/AcrR family acrAB operon transcriptional repressor
MAESANAKMESAKAKKAAETRESIVNVCIRMFAERGFVSTSLDEIGRAAGITKGAIYWHFENKDALFTAILSRIREIWDEEVLQPLSAEGSPRRKLQQLFDHYEELFKEDPFVCLFLHRVLMDADDRFAPQVDKVFEETTGLIAKVLADGASRGEFRSDVEADTLARLIVSALAGAHLQAKYSRGVTLNALLAELREAVLLRATIRRIGTS